MWSRSRRVKLLCCPRTSTISRRLMIAVNRLAICIPIRPENIGGWLVFMKHPRTSGKVSPDHELEKKEPRFAAKQKNGGHHTISIWTRRIRIAKTRSVRDFLFED